MIVKTPPAPYIAVIFTSLKNEAIDAAEYEKMNVLTEEQSNTIDGYIGCESVRESAQWGITVSYWKDMDAVNQWKRNVVHQMAKQKGVKEFYAQYAIRICEVKENNFFIPG